MTGLDAVLVGFVSLSVLAAARAVTSTRIVQAALHLVLALGALAGVYLTLGAEVIALVQLLVYVGAVVVLLLFALMLTRAPAVASREIDQSRPRKVLAAVTGLAGGGVVLVALLAAGPGTVPRLGPTGQAHALGTALFTSWVLPFELLSVLLLAALVGAIALSRAQVLPRRVSARSTAPAREVPADAEPPAGPPAEPPVEPPGGPGAGGPGATAAATILPGRGEQR